MNFSEKPTAFPTCPLLPLTPYLLLVFPVIVFAQDSISFFKPQPGSVTFLGVANKLGAIANAVIPFLIGVAIVAVIWGIFKYITAAGDAEKIADGRKAALYGVIALFLMVAFWGLVLVIKRSLFG